MEKELLSSGIVYLIITIVVTIVIFLIFRALVLWYWKINKIVGYLKEISDNIKLLKGDKTSAYTDSWACPKCGSRNPSNKYTCENCKYKIV